MASAYLTRAMNGNSTTTGTISLWVKRTNIGQHVICSFWEDSSTYQRVQFDSSDRLNWKIFDNGTLYGEVTSTDKFRDTNGWYHIVSRVDTTQSTSSDRVRLYVNGDIITNLDDTNYPTQNRNVKQSAVPYIGSEGTITSARFDGCMTHVHYTDAASNAPTVFGETDATTGQWKIKTNISTTYGAKGFFILKDGNSGTDHSGNSNTFTVSGTITDMVDSPSNIYNCWNRLNEGSISGIQTNGWGNVGSYVAAVAANQNRSFGSTLAFPGTGKFYCEFKVGNLGTYYGIGIGEAEAMGSNVLSSGQVKFSDNAKGWSYKNNGKKENGGSEATYGDTYTSYDYLQIAYNNGTLWFGKNGTWQNSATASEIAAGTTTNSAYTGLDTSQEYYIMFAGYNDSMVEMNSGNGYFRTTVAGSNNPSSGDTAAKFKYTVPTGLQPISTKGFNQ